YKKLGQYEVKDHIDAAKYLIDRYDFIDEERIGICGWSYGGYMSSLVLAKGGDVFNTAIAVAPVTSWRFYDTIYTERFMQTPSENPEGYKKGAPLTYANQMSGNYLLIHGTSDDNVHFQNSVAMINQLVASNFQFQTMYYPDRNHGIYGGNTRKHLYSMMNRYILNNLSICDVYSLLIMQKFLLEVVPVVPVRSIFDGRNMYREEVRTAEMAGPAEMLFCAVTNSSIHCSTYAIVNMLMLKTESREKPASAAERAGKMKLLKHRLVAWYMTQILKSGWEKYRSMDRSLL